MYDDELNALLISFYSCAILLGDHDRQIRGSTKNAVMPSLSLVDTNVPVQPLVADLLPPQRPLPRLLGLLRRERRSILPAASLPSDNCPETGHGVDLISPFISEMFNRSLATGRFPAGFRQAFKTPIVKKPGLDATDASSYQPMSNISVMYKLLELLVACQLVEYMLSAGNVGFDQVTRQKLLCYMCSLTFCWQWLSIVETWLL